jgi:hypothetical protein
MNPQRLHWNMLGHEKGVSREVGTNEALLYAFIFILYRTRGSSSRLQKREDEKLFKAAAVAAGKRGERGMQITDAVFINAMEIVGRKIDKPSCIWLFSYAAAAIKKNAISKRCFAIHKWWVSKAKERDEWSRVE